VTAAAFSQTLQSQLDSNPSRCRQLGAVSILHLIHPASSELVIRSHRRDLDVELFQARVTSEPNLPALQMHPTNPRTTIAAD
jgi:hypothetical protein